MDCLHNFLLFLFKPTKLPEGIVYLWSTEITHHFGKSMHILHNSNSLIVKSAKGNPITAHHGRCKILALINLIFFDVIIKSVPYSF